MNRQERRRMGIKKKVPMISIKQSDIDRMKGEATAKGCKLAFTLMIRNLDLKYINIMIDDIDRQREYGMDMDKDEWMKLLGRLRAERERRFKNGNYR